MFVSQQLRAEHDVASFGSGEDSLDDWLRRSALDARKRGTARTFVWSDSGRVVAYYSLAAFQLVRADLPKRLSRGGPDRIPCVLLARLALDSAYRGRGLGGVLLSDATGRVYEATRTVAARYVVVDALHEPAAGFYAHHGFEPLHDPLRLVRRVASIAADVAPDDRMPG